MMWLCIAVISGAGVAAALLLLRLARISWRTHRAEVVALHLGLLIAAVWALYEAAGGAVTPGGCGGLLAGLAWLRLSHATWWREPPEYTRRPGAKRG